MNALFGLFEGAFAPSHIIIVLLVGVLLFGKRLPEIGRVVGKAFKEFKNGIRGMEDEWYAPPALPHTAAPEPIRPPQRVTASVPKFENNQPANPPPQV